MPFDFDVCFPQLFEAQVIRTPDAIAVRFEGMELSYADLNRRANQLAYHLREQGIGPDVVVPVMLERSLEMVISLLAVMKAGGAYLPLIPGLPLTETRGNDRGRPSLRARDQFRASCHTSAP